MDSAKIDFPLDPLPKDFVLYKPLQQDRFDEKVIYELEKAGRLIITRKRDGWKMFAVKSGGKIKLYTDGMNEIDARIAHIKDALQLMLIPNNSILVGELLFDDGGDDQFKKVGAVMSASFENALKIQMENCPGSLLRYMIFDIVVRANVNLLSKPYDCRLRAIEQLYLNDDGIGLVSDDIVRRVSQIYESYDKAKKLVKKNGWEGLVLYDRNFTASYRLDGKNPARPKGCYKWKPLYEDDFIVRKWLPKDDDPKKLKEVVLLQIHPKTGKEFECGKLGSFDAKMREQLRTAKYPLVMEVQYEARYESGKLRNARFMRLRPEKKAKDCVAPKKFK